MSERKILETRIVSSLTKVFADEELKAKSVEDGIMLKNEVYSFQIAYCLRDIQYVVEELSIVRFFKHIKIRINSDLGEFIDLRKVELVPVEMPCFLQHDDKMLRTSPGLYPDLLVHPDDEGLVLFPYQWRSVWVTIDGRSGIKPGKYNIEFIFEWKDVFLARESFELEVLNAELPELDMICSHWFHADCLATWYRVDIFSEEHWNIIDKYIKTAAEHGMNMLLTPLFTTPIDTQIGSERPTVQLVDVEKHGNGYKFGFDRLKRWIHICRSNGIKYFEFSHFFTQWGAKNAPKIMAWENGEYKKIFGWETEASGNEYKEFLGIFIPELLAFIRNEGIDNKYAYFHISDEPKLRDIEFYKEARKVVYHLLKDYTIIDALSDYEFYETGLVKNPIVATNHIEPFIENKVPDLLAYYCTGQFLEVSNREMSMPSIRNRIIGMQLYKFGLAGFLHWGYNFWYSDRSRKKIDPYRNTHGMYWFLPGDGFLVYPGEDGPLESVRMEVFHEALQDIRAFKLLEKAAGKQYVLKIIEEELEAPITFSIYPLNDSWFLSVRERIYKEIENRLITDGGEM